mmetsp:Transcript_8198/g.17119  ORF Transcript_8198/g.17119 Transcript_8198/m.17119 type:complete len:274 (+) Transcript_8198:123-944(+)
MSESALAPPPSLVLVAKYPSESSKTRLRPALGHAGTVSFAMACLVDSLTRLATVTAGSGKEVKRYVLYAPASAKEDFEGLLRTVPGDWKAVPMTDSTLRTSNLTGKLQGGLEVARTGGAGAVAFVGMDSPHLSAAEVSRALTLSASESLGYIKPARDGGYMLISLPAAVGGEVFEGVEWSSEVTFATQIRQLCSRTEVRVGEVGFDIDSVADLNSLHELVVQSSGLELKECREFFKTYKPKDETKANPNVVLTALLLMGFTVGFAIGKARYKR